MSATPLPSSLYKAPTVASANTVKQAPVVLAFDTSTELLAVALLGGAKATGPAPHSVRTTAPVHTHLAPGGAAASATLLPAVHMLLAQAHLALADVQTIAFGCGPGAFTGLRTACAVAQGLGWGLNVPLLPICSLLVVAEDCRWQLQQQGPTAPVLDVAVVMDARMGEVYSAVFRWHGAAGAASDGATNTAHTPGQWQVQVPPALLTLPALAQVWASAAVPTPVVLAGSALLAFGDRLPAWPGPSLRCNTEHNRAAALLRLALQAHAAGAGVAAADALPQYLRDNVAQTTEARQTAQRAKADAARLQPMANVLS
jgi:tRNA threonylcarbamoyladenosine biosynthesis protein TsaB